MLRRESHSRRSMFALAGWLFADLFLVLTMLFFTNAQAWVVHKPSPPQICGMDPKINPPVTITAPDPFGLRQERPSALGGFANKVKGALQKDAKRIAGFVEVFGGSPDVNDGTRFASGAIRALQLLKSQKYIFTSQTVFFKPLWSGSLRSNQVMIYIFFFQISSSCNAQT